MARIRSIKPTFFRSEDVSVLPLRARLTWIGLWTHCDDAGRAKDNARLIKGDVWPLDDVSLREIENDLETLAGHGRIVRYEVDGKRYLEIVNWRDHQAISKPTPSRIPGPEAGRVIALTEPPRDPYEDPDDDPDQSEPIDSGRTPGGLPEDSGRTPVGKGRERKGGEGKGGEARASVREAAPPPIVPTFMPPTDETLINPEPPGTFAGVGHHGLQEGPAGTTPTGQLDPDEPPPNRCPKHIRTLGEVPPCRPCGAAKAEHQQWQARRISSEAAARSSAAREHAEAVRTEIDACDLCDATGRLDSGQLCLHDPANPDRSRRGAAAARSAIRSRSTEVTDP